MIQNEIRNEPFQLNSMTVVPINGYHHKLQVFGFRFNEFAYLTDMKTVADEEIEKLKDVKVLVVNALRETEHISHFNLKEALDFIDRVKPEKAYLTHISHHMGFHDVVQQSLPENVYLAYDNLQIHV